MKNLNEQEEKMYSVTLKDERYCAYDVEIVKAANEKQATDILRKKYNDDFLYVTSCIEVVFDEYNSCAVYFG